MDPDHVFWASIAIGTVSYIFSFRAQRNQGLYIRRLRVRRILAAMAGSRSNWVDCSKLANQIGAVTLPVWHLLLRNIPGVDQALLLFLFWVLTIGISRISIESTAKRRLKSAEYIIPGSLFRFQLPAIGSGLLENETVCSHCGFREQWFDFPDMGIEGDPKDTCLGLSSSTDLPSAMLLPRELAETFRKESVSGCTLSPTGHTEPADFFALHSDHILPPAIFAPNSRKSMPYRTPNCAENHGIELSSESRDVDISYRRASFRPPDVSSSYELFGGKMRQGGRFLVVSQKVFRLLIKFDKELLWMCRPVILVD